MKLRQNTLKHEKELKEKFKNARNERCSGNVIHKNFCTYYKCEIEMKKNYMIQYKL